MFLVAYVPPLWRAVMDPRLLQAVGRDLRRLTLDPRQRNTAPAHF
jgi:alkane 1-monooxygenase